MIEKTELQIVKRSYFNYSHRRQKVWRAKKIWPNMAYPRKKKGLYSKFFKMYSLVYKKRSSPKM